MSLDTAELKDEVESSSKWINPLKEEMSKILVGQDNLVENLIIGLLTKGHLLI